MSRCKKPSRFLWGGVVLFTVLVSYPLSYPVALRFLSSDIYGLYDYDGSTQLTSVVWSLFSPIDRAFKWVPTPFREIYDAWFKLVDGQDTLTEINDREEAREARRRAAE